jgi:hypothetical protein
MEESDPWFKSIFHAGLKNYTRSCKLMQLQWQGKMAPADLLKKMDPDFRLCYSSRHARIPLSRKLFISAGSPGH